MGFFKMMKINARRHFGDADHGAAYNPDQCVGKRDAAGGRRSCFCRLRDDARQCVGRYGKRSGCVYCHFAAGVCAAVLDCHSAFPRRISLVLPKDRRRRWALLLYSPLFAMAAMFIISGGDQPRAVILFAFLLSVVWLLIATVLLTIVGLRYFLAPYLLAAYPGRKIRALIRDGVRKVNGHKGRLFLFSLSFIGWYLPLVAVLGLIIFLPFASNVFMTLQILGIMILLLVLQLGLMLFVGPYTRAALAMYARYLIERSEHDDMDSGADNRTREYKPEIDHYLESQRTRELSGGSGDSSNPHDPPV